MGNILLPIKTPMKNPAEKVKNPSFPIGQWMFLLYNFRYGCSSCGSDFSLQWWHRAPQWGSPFQCIPFFSSFRCVINPF